MRLTPLAVALALSLAGSSRAAVQAAGAAPTQVMIVGVFHMANPGHDLYDTKVDDVLAPRRQAEIAAVTAGLARFRPTKVAVEWPAATVAERYPNYLAGNLPPSRNEVVQLGFRLAKTAGRAPVFGIDADGDLPIPQLFDYAKAHGFQPLIDRENAQLASADKEAQRILDRQGVAAALGYLNRTGYAEANNSWYRSALRIGAGDDQPGVDLEAAWYRRNFLICAHLLQIARPGDRIVVFFGAGHEFLLRQCVRETPGLRLVEPIPYLPK
jgi:hypothetical protein